MRLVLPLWLHSLMEERWIVSPQVSFRLRVESFILASIDLIIADGSERRAIRSYRLNGIRLRFCKPTMQDHTPLGALR